MPRQVHFADGSRPGDRYDDTEERAADQVVGEHRGLPASTTEEVTIFEAPEPMESDSSCSTIRSDSAPQSPTPVTSPECEPPEPQQQPAAPQTNQARPRTFWDLFCRRKSREERRIITNDRNRNHSDERNPSDQAADSDALLLEDDFLDADAILEARNLARRRRSNSPPETQHSTFSSSRGIPIPRGTTGCQRGISRPGLVGLACHEDGLPPAMLPMRLGGGRECGSCLEVWVPWHINPRVDRLRYMQDQSLQRREQRLMEEEGWRLAREWGWL